MNHFLQMLTQAKPIARSWTPYIILGKLCLHFIKPKMNIGLILITLLIGSACDDESPADPPLPPLSDLGLFCENQCDLGTLDMEMEARLPQCQDNLDNDGDGLIDGFDPGCANEADDDERNSDQIPECEDGIDNDGDSYVDYPADPECASPMSLYEARPEAPTPECSDGIDNDNDGNIDYPVDQGCANANDQSEAGNPPNSIQCSDAIDNDGDGYVDLSDPGCSGADDPLELNGVDEPRPWCSDGIDNDEDGWVDFPRDPGCSFAGDNDELTPPFKQACRDDEDNDGDGLIDWPNDPGCAGKGDDDETDLLNPPHCSDGIDNDDDSKIDYPDDVGCLSRGDDQEYGACGAIFESEILQDGVTVRGIMAQGSFVSEGSCGGRAGREIVFRYLVKRPLQALLVTTDLPENQIESALYVRRRCQEVESEILCSREVVDGFPANNIRIENPEQGEYFIVLDAVDNAGGPFAIRLHEEIIAQCRNEIDDDFNGLTDFPNDPGCDDPYDNEESEPNEVPVCSDEIDNDGDFLTDFPNDVGCLYAGANSEEDACGQGVSVKFFPTGRKEIIGDTYSEGSNRFNGSCGGNNTREQVFYYQQPFSALVTFSVDHPETEQDTLLYIRKDNCSRLGEGDTWLNEYGCGTGSGEERKATLSVNMSPGVYYVFVDHPGGVGGPFKLTTEFERLPPSCQNMLDDDGDGFIDHEDFGCESRQDDFEEDLWVYSELLPEEKPICYNQLDDDEDGFTDFPFDPGCDYKSDSDETDSERAPICFNQLDDDQDGLFDYPADPGCYAASDEVETDERPLSQCNNRLDDDQDGQTDYPNDPHCLAPGDLSEYDDSILQECGNEIDDDEDLLIDYPNDPGCLSKGGVSETDPVDVPACGNGIDDDEDELIDYPAEPGCIAASDNDETDPEPTPQCGNGVDDDGDRAIDWPNDPQCTSASDRSEAR